MVKSFWFFECIKLPTKRLHSDCNPNPKHNPKNRNRPDHHQDIAQTIAPSHAVSPLPVNLHSGRYFSIPGEHRTDLWSRTLAKNRALGVHRCIPRDPFSGFVGVFHAISFSFSVVSCLAGCFVGHDSPLASFSAARAFMIAISSS